MAWCFSSVAPFHSVCEPPDMVKAAFSSVTQGKDSMDAAALAEFRRTVQHEETATAEQARKDMVDFISYSMERSGSRSLKVLGFRTGSQHSSRGSSKRGLLSRETTPQPEEPSPLFTLKAFLKFLLNPGFNGYQTPVSKTPTEDMTAPLSDYFIFASHNTYLTGNQLTSESSTFPIVKALQSGCRVIELDCWSGLDGKINVLDCLSAPSRKINVLHGRTFTKAVAFEDCIQAIKDSAFIKSDYPVILTIENHLTPAHQKHAARVLREILGDMMFHPPEKGKPPKSFLSPAALKNRIIISDKPPGDSVISQVAEDPVFAEKVFKDSIWKQAPKVLRKIVGDVNCISSTKDRPPKPDKPPGDSSVLTQVYRSDSSESEEGSHSTRIEKKIHRRKSQVVDELRVLRTRSMSPVSDDAEIPKDPEFEELLYIHCQKPSEMKPKHEKGRPLIAGDNAIMANLSESQLEDIIEHHPNSLIKFSQSNLGRVYPFGLRFNSSNADPLDAWRHGVQVAAINMQGRDRPVWISRAFFRRNAGCGYVKKPDILLTGSSFRYLKSSTQEYMTDLQPKLELKILTKQNHKTSTQEVLFVCAHVWNPITIATTYFYSFSHAIMYFMQEGQYVVIVIKYVDDLIILANLMSSMKALKAMLEKEYEMSDLGELHFYLGVEFVRDKTMRTITMSQGKYVIDVLKRFGMKESKPVATPLDANFKLVKLTEEEYAAEAQLMTEVPYKQVVGSLMYAMIATRPDLAYPISVVSQHMARPGSKHWMAVKRIMRYLKGTYNVNNMVADVLTKCARGGLSNGAFSC